MAPAVKDVLAINTEGQRYAKLRHYRYSRTLEEEIEMSYDRK
jgi:hypothetical protein